MYYVIIFLTVGTYSERTARGRTFYDHRTECILHSAALLAKESVVTLPLILLAYEVFYGKGRAIPWRVAYAALAAHFGVLAVYLFVRSQVLNVATVTRRGW